MVSVHSPAHFYLARCGRKIFCLFSAAHILAKTHGFGTVYDFMTEDMTLSLKIRLPEDGQKRIEGFVAVAPTSYLSLVPPCTLLFHVGFCMTSFFFFFLFFSSMCLRFYCDLVVTYALTLQG